MSEQDIPSLNDALNEYFSLKEKFENTNKSIKKKIINNSTLSKREKRSMYLTLRPKCVNCKRPSKLGTLFSIVFHPSDNKTDEYRSFKASCGDLADPCNLDININIGSYEPLDKLMNDIRNEINTIKNEIINDKNKLLFGLITTESAIENFDNNKSYINILTSVYEKYLNEWNNIVENPQKKLELEESLVQSYTLISEIKYCIKKFNETGDNKYTVDAANIYHKTLKPTLDKIRNLKYKETLVFNDDSENVCKLIQKPYSEINTLITGYNSKVISYDVGLKAKKFTPKKKLLIIESDEEKEEEPMIKIVPRDSQGVLEDEPIIGKGEDGIEWNEPEYQKLWSKLPPKLKSAFKLNIDWMNEFMKKCVNEQIKKPIGWNGCRLTTPPNIVIPPRKMENGQYDFGVSIYNEVFNKQPTSLQNTYLTFYKNDPSTKEKNYKMLEDALNLLVEKEVNFSTGFF
jgi:hypothetical protein